MANATEHFFNNPKVQQVAIQFGFRIPVRQELNPGTKKSLQNVLTDLSPEIFQMFNERPQGNTGCLFQSHRQLILGVQTITFPAFALNADNVIFYHPIKILGQQITKSDPIDASNKNQEISSWFLEVQKVIKTAPCHRTGKIYELVLGPFLPSDKEQVFKELLKINLDNIGEMAMTFANYVTQEEDTYNIQTNLQYMQLKLDDQFGINVRVDINNRNLESSMEPNAIEKVWKFADKEIDNHLMGIFNI
ncbi:MAG: hypothetical protein V1871_00795 [Planctomycetota bacterium]